MLKKKSDLQGIFHYFAYFFPTKFQLIFQVKNFSQAINYSLENAEKLNGCISKLNPLFHIPPLLLPPHKQLIVK